MRRRARPTCCCRHAGKHRHARIREWPPSIPLPDPKAEIGFVPFGRNERFVEQSDGIEARAPHDPGADDQIDFLQPKPVHWRGTDRALKTSPVVQIVPPGDRIGHAGAVQPSTETEKPKIGVGGKRRQKLGDQPWTSQKHVVLPGQQERGFRFAEPVIRAPQLVKVVLVVPVQVPLAPGGCRQRAQVIRRRIGAAVFDDQDLHRLIAGDGLPRLEAGGEHLDVVERRNDDGQGWHVGGAARPVRHDTARSGAAAASSPRRAATVCLTSKRASYSAAARRPISSR